MAAATRVTHVRKRDGRVVPFDQEKITNAIFKAAQSVGGDDRDRAVYVSNLVCEMLDEQYGDWAIPSVEDIQDLVERALIRLGHAKTAKSYILYRDLHNKLRDIRALVDANELIEGYLGHLDWRVKENSNMSFSLQGLNNHIFSAVNSSYWLNSLYPKEVRNAHISGDLHLHDLYILAVYCCGWDLRDLLLRGFGSVPGKVDCAPQAFPYGPGPDRQLFLHHSGRVSRRGGLFRVRHLPGALYPLRRPGPQRSAAGVAGVYL